MGAIAAGSTRKLFDREHNHALQFECISRSRSSGLFDRDWGPGSHKIAEIRHTMVTKVRFIAGYPVKFSELRFFRSGIEIDDNDYSSNDASDKDCFLLSK